MRILIATTDAQVLRPLLGPLLQAGHRVVGTTTTLAGLTSYAQTEPEALLLVLDPLDSAPEALRAALSALQRPTALVVPQAWTRRAFRELAYTLRAPASPEQILEAIAHLVKERTDTQQSDQLPNRTATPKGPEHHEASMPAPPAAEASLPPSRPAVSPQVGTIQITVYPVVGGVGASALTLALATAGAQGQLASLAVTQTPAAFAARLGLALDQVNHVRQLGEYLWITARPPEDLGDFSLVVWDLHPPVSEPPLEGKGPLLLLTRATGEGRLNVIRAVARVRRERRAATRVLVSPGGSLSAQEFAALCRSDLPDFPPVQTLPFDDQVPVLEDTVGIALDAPRYGPVVRELARTMAPGLPWPVETPQRLPFPFLNVRLTE